MLLMAGVAFAQTPDRKEPINEAKIPTKDYLQTYHQSFTGSVVRPEGWNYASRLSEECVRFEPTGLRITLPPGGPEKGQSAGVVTDFGVKGDFEITLKFAAIKDPDAKDVGQSGTRLTLSVVLDTDLLGTAKQEVATLSRSMASKGFVAWARSRHHPTVLTEGFPTPAETGRLQLVRSGAELFYCASVGEDQPIKLLTKYRFGADDVKRLAISGQTGGKNALVDMRISDFRIRADAIPDAPAPPLAVVAQPGAATPREGRGGALLGAAILALAVLVVLSLGFLFRKRGRPPGASAELATISFACPHCAKSLRARTDLAGKKVKCGQCGAGVLVPTPASDETGGRAL
jgi:hypothetical protein